jgi:predicted AlkP superfamily phosphohydrolase/phosphomutase
MLGLDGLTPGLLFKDYWPRLPNLHRLAKGGRFGPLRSCDPPITVPAWACMVTGLDPGTLGCYGFNDRADRGYTRRRLASSLSYVQPPLWTLLSQAGRRCRVLGVPQTYPAKPLNGTMVTGALTPSMRLPYSVYPPELSTWLAAREPPYACDIADFRSVAPAQLVREVDAMTAGTFGIVAQWLTADDWDFLFAVDMGADRLQHALWACARPEHPDYAPGHPLAHALRDYYISLDGYIGAVMDELRPDDVLWVVSDHGAQAMQGAFALNDWLVQTGRLVLRADAQPKATPWRLQPEHIDWPRTQAWADGGYVGRIYLNVLGREPEGKVPTAQAPQLLAALAEELAALSHTEHGEHTIWQPQARYAQVRGIAPDLVVEMGGLHLRVLGTLGHPTLWPKHNDRGYDTANHAQDGLYLVSPQAGGEQPASLYDVAPSVLTQLGVPIPKQLHGTPLQAKA